MRELTFAKIKEELRKEHKVILVDKENDNYIALAFTSEDELVLESPYGDVSIIEENELESFVIKGQEPIDVVFKRYFFKKPNEVGWKFHASDITGMNWSTWRKLQERDVDDDADDPSSWELLGTKIEASFKVEWEKNYE